jgi:hypothetical protein
MHTAPNALAAVPEARWAPEGEGAGIDRAGQGMGDATGAAKIIVDALDIGPAKLAGDRDGIGARERRIGGHRDRFRATPPLIIAAKIRAS